MTVEAADHVARTSAALALEKIASHERRCEERWIEARTEMRAMRSEIGQVGASISTRNAAVYGRIWWLVGLIIMGLIAAIGWLVPR